MASSPGLDLRRSPKGPVIALLASVLLLCTYFAVNIWSTMASADALALARTSRAVNATFADQARQLEKQAEDNAFWDDAYVALAQTQPDADFIWDNWGSVTNGDLYDQAFVLDEQGQMVYNFRDKAKAPLSEARQLGAGLNALRSRLGRGANRASGLIKSGDDYLLVALATIRPVDLGLQHSTRQRHKHYLGFAWHIDEKRLKLLGENLGLTGLSFEPREDADKIMIKLASAENVALYWQPFIPGNIALKQAFPLLAIGFFAILGAIGLLARFGMEAVNEVNRMALIDPLSQLPNRRALRAEMERLVKSGEPLALAFIDLDGFKAINDSHGHAVGDALITDCATVLKDVAKKSAMIARLGGDEFAVLYASEHAATDIRAFSDALMKRLNRPFRLGERTIVIGASIGLCESSGDLPANELMRRADMAMYASKTDGKGQFRWFDDSFDQKQNFALQIETDLAAAIRDGQIHPRYQPVIEARTGQIVAVEGLARWQRADGTKVPPSIFIPVAEQCGLIAKLGDQLIRNAIDDARQLGDVRLAINLSPFQLRHPDFATSLVRILAETEFPAQRVELDIKEGFLIDSPVHAAETLARLHAIGVALVLDDFGSGPTSIGFLRQFRFSKVKLAPRCIVDAQSDEVARAIIHATVSLAHRLSMRVVAEGVETAEQADFMVALGCDELQGWYFSKSLGLKELLDRMNEPQKVAAA